MNRKWFFLLILVFAALASACSGQEVIATGIPTTATPITAPSEGTAADAAKAYINAALGDGNVTEMFCSTLPDEVKQQIQDSLDVIKGTFAAMGTTVDISQLTYSTENQSGDSAEVVVAGN